MPYWNHGANLKAKPGEYGRRPCGKNKSSIVNSTGTSAAFALSVSPKVVIRDKTLRFRVPVSRLNTALRYSILDNSSDDS